jgi:hypothetical protein
MLSNLEPDDYLNDALECGIKLGFIGSADHSWGHPGDDFWWPLGPYQGGLAAILSRNLTREGIWEGLYARRCYATTRARILLELSVNGHPMGTEMTASGSRELSIGVFGTVAIETIEVVKNNRIWKTVPGNGGRDRELTLTDSVSERQTDYYYVHAVQADGEQAWSSPVWVNGG